MMYEKIALSHCELVSYVPTPSVEMPPKPAIVICPGGGYSHLSPREAEPVALVFASMGFNAYVVYYRIAPNRYPVGLLDVAEAVAWVRANAADQHTNPDAIAVAGFSAGGHVACSLGVRWQDEALLAKAGLTPAQVRPNAMLLAYPVITGGEFAHRGSFVSLTGTEDLAEHEKHSLDALVTPNTPPTFLWHTWEDGAVPVENTLMMAAALRRAKVLTEVHIFPHGGHGLGLANAVTAMPGCGHCVPECAAWPELAARFLRDAMLNR